MVPPLPVAVSPPACPICLEQYSRHNRFPQTLNCGHSFCCKCVRTIGRGSSVILCGICRKNTYAHYSQVGKSFTLISLLENYGLLAADEETGTSMADEPPPDEWRGAGELLTARDLAETYDRALDIEEMINRRLLENNQSAAFRNELAKSRRQIRTIENQLRASRENFTVHAEKMEQLEVRVRQSICGTSSLFGRRFGRQPVHFGFGASILLTDDDNEDWDNEVAVPPTSDRSASPEWMSQHYIRNLPTNRAHCYLCDIQMHNNEVMAHVNCATHNENVNNNRRQIESSRPCLEQGMHRSEPTNVASFVPAIDFTSGGWGDQEDVDEWGHQWMANNTSWGATESANTGGERGPEQQGDASGGTIGGSPSEGEAVPGPGPSSQPQTETLNVELDARIPYEQSQSIFFDFGLPVAQNVRSKKRKPLQVVTLPANPPDFCHWGISEPDPWDESGRPSLWEREGASAGGTSAQSSSRLLEEFENGGFGALTSNGNSPAVGPPSSEQHGQGQGQRDRQTAYVVTRGAVIKIKRRQLD